MASIRGTALLVGCGAGWAAVWLAPHGQGQYVVPAVFALGAFLMHRTPVLGALVIGAGQAAGLALGAPHDNPSGLVVGLGAMYLLGKRSRLPHALAPILVAWAVIVQTDLTPVRQVLGLALFGAAFGLGAGVRIRSQRARDAETEVRELEAEVVAIRARRIVAVERQRLAREAAELLSVATREMRELAREAMTTLGPGDVEQVRQRGIAAVAELRTLLEMLRAPTPSATARATPTPSGRFDVLADVALALGITGLMVGEWTLQAVPPSPWLLMATGALVFSRREPVLSCLTAAAALFAQGFAGRPFQVGPAVALGVWLVAWRAAAPPPEPGDSAKRANFGRWSPRHPSGGHMRGRVLALLLLLGGCLVSTVPHGGSQAAVLGSVLLVAAAGSRVWHRLEAQHGAATARSAAYERRLQAAVESAVVEERLRVARDLHDVASRAIGVMLMQATAAKANCAGDAPVARQALATVVSTGDEALEGVGALERSLAAMPGASLRTALDDLCARMRRADLDVRFSMSTTVRSPETAEVAWRVVNEAFTNVLKHAPGARVDLDLQHVGADLVVRLRDHGAAAQPGGAVGTGFGLQGLDELVRRSRGSLRHGVLPTGRGGGFEVQARLPDAPTTPDREPLGSARHERDL